MKIVKWILGLLAGIAGIVAMFGGQSKKEIKKKIKQNKKKISKKTKEIKNFSYFSKNRDFPTSRSDRQLTMMISEAFRSFWLTQI